MIFTSVYAFLSFLLQLSVAPDFNLLFCSILVFAAALPFVWTMWLALLYVIFSSLFFYDSALLWQYLLVAFVAGYFNPKQVPDKFLIVLLYSILFTAFWEFFNPNSLSYLDNLIESVLLNSAMLVPLYFLLRLLFNKQWQALRD